MPDREKISLIMRYALLVASQEDDPYDRQLGPIHLIKYVYLADMEYAKYNTGQIFTGVDWTFHNFGPWSPFVHDEVDLSLSQWGAKKMTLQSKFGEDDYTRWSIDFDQQLFTDLKAEFPIEVRHAIAMYVHNYTNDTSALLHFVYATLPILKAAPGDHLDFSVMVARQTQEQPDKFTPMLARLSKKKAKLINERMCELRARFTQRMQQRVISSPQRPTTAPDEEIFIQGVKWLDKLAGADFPKEGAEVTFSNQVWKSEIRSGDA